MPAHGFARVADWQLVSAVRSGDEFVFVLALPQPTDLIYAAAQLQLEVRIGQALNLSLTTQNSGADPLRISEALHTYFQVSDIAHVRIGGLEGVHYWDTVGEVNLCSESGPIAFTAETDRVYIHSPETCRIDDPGLKRSILIEKSGSLSTVVWNPWTAKAVRMGDLGQPEGWRGFVCVESANAWDNCLSLAPGETHVLTAAYRVESLG